MLLYAQAHIFCTLGFISLAATTATATVTVAKAVQEAEVPAKGNHGWGGGGGAAGGWGATEITTCNGDPVSHDIPLSSALGDATISPDWLVGYIPQILSTSANAWTVINYPLARGSTATDYEPHRDYSQQFDTIILVPIHEPSTSTALGSLLGNWIDGQISAHYIITRDAANVIKWISGRYATARLPCGDGGPASEQGRQLVIAVQTLDGDDGRVSDVQIEVIRELIWYNGPSTSNNIRLRNLASLAELSSLAHGGHGKRSGGRGWCVGAGRIVNIEQIRESLCLSNPFY